MAPGAAAAPGVAETALSDFFARVVLDESGRLNLQDVARTASADGAGIGGGRRGIVAARRVVGAPRRRRHRRRSCSFGPIAVVGGRINYNDRFVKPNYNANLSELSGRLGAFSSRAAGSRASRRSSPS